MVIISDSRTKYMIEEITPQPNLNIKWLIMLNKYSKLDRNAMEQQGIWSEFQMFKAVAIQQALMDYSD